MGIILGALGGLGNAMQDIGRTGFANELERERQMDLQAERAKLEEQKEKNILALKQQYADKERTDRVARIDAEQTGIVNKQIVDKANSQYTWQDDQGTESPIASVDELTDEDRKEFEPTAKERLAARVEAAIKTGDLDEKTAAGLLKADETQAALTLRQMERLDRQADDKERDRRSREEMAANKRENDRFLKAMTIAGQADKRSNAATAEERETARSVDVIRGEIRDINKELRDARKESGKAILDEDKAEVRQRIQELESDRRDAESRLGKLLPKAAKEDKPKPIISTEQKPKRDLSKYLINQ